MGDNATHENIAKMKINDSAQLLVDYYSKKQPIETEPLMFWGPPGIGKSDMFKTVKNTLATAVNKKIEIHDIRLLLFSPVDLRGIPVPDVEKKFAKWLRPEIFNMDESPDVINILLFDEISAAPPSVQAASYQLTLNRTIGEHKLADNCIIVAAGNRVTDKSVAYQMPKALANRFTHIELECSVSDWRKWAIPNNIDPRIVSFLTFKNNALFKFDPMSDDNAFPTPRSWAKVSTYLEIFSLEQAMPLITGTVGMGAAIEFKSYTNVFSSLPDIEAIKRGKGTKCSNRPDVMYALASSLVSHAVKASQVELDNIIKYSMNNMDDEFQLVILKDIVQVPEIITKALRAPSWIDWSAKFKKYI